MWPITKGTTKAKNKTRMNVSVQGSIQSDDEETEFFDAEETSEQPTEFTVDVPYSTHRRTSSGISVDSQVTQNIFFSMR